VESLLQVKYKLGEIISRSLFLILMIYFLPIELSGKFGFITVLFSLFATFYGFERHVSLQRQIINESDEIVTNRLTSVLKFNIINFAITIPVMFLFIKTKTFDNWFLIFCCLLISFVEHISNSVYNISIVYEKFLKGMPFIIIKNIVLLIVAAFLIFFTQRNPLETVLIIWALISLIQIFFFGRAFYRITMRFKIDLFKFEVKSISYQYKLAYINFFIGLVAVLSIQADRLIVGISFDSINTGMYFRHVSIISILYQIFYITSYNKLLKRVLLKAKTETFDKVVLIVYREYKRDLIFILLGIFVITIVFSFFSQFIFSKFHIKLPILLFLLTVFSIRIYADFRSMVLNAYHLEYVILKCQTLSMVIGILLMLVLIPIMGLNGVLASSLISTCIYATSLKLASI
jgi:O-antigen/teichoic acid export membrane protein